MQGIFINMHRPKSKKAVREAIAADPGSVNLEAASLFGNEYSGQVANAPDGKYLFVGPDPYTSRKFYGTVTVSGGTAKVT